LNEGLMHLCKNLKFQKISFLTKTVEQSKVAL